MADDTELFETAAPTYDAAKFPPPREFQVKAHEALRQGARDGHRCQLLMSSTGSGKTYLGMRVIHEALRKGKRCIFVCDRRVLIQQTSAVADNYGLSSHGIVMADHWRYAPSMPFQIASAQTLAARKWPDDLDVVVIDECHVQLRVWVDYLKTFKGHSVLLSATPFSPGLGKIATNLVNAATTHELTESGVLVPMKVFSCTRVNMKDAATSGGEWTDAAAAERGMEIVGDVVTEWVKYGDGRKTIVFGATIAHCEEMCRQFNEAGIMAAVFCATTTNVERERLLDEYRKPDSVLRILLSVAALSRGFDVPDVGCICDVRPLRKSLSEFVQMIGRGARSSPATGKEDFRLLDFSGNVIRFMEDFTEFYFNGLDKLDDGEKLDKTIRTEKDEDEKRACPKCGFRPFAKKCIGCGFEIQKAALIEHEVGEMREIMIGKNKAADNARDLWCQCATNARSWGNPETTYGRACHLYRSICGQFPPKHWRMEETPNVPISKPVLNKLRHNRIQWSKRRAA